MEDPRIIETVIELCTCKLQYFMCDLVFAHSVNKENSEDFLGCNLVTNLPMHKASHPTRH